MSIYTTAEWTHEFTQMVLQHEHSPNGSTYVALYAGPTALYAESLISLSQHFSV